MDRREFTKKSVLVGSGLIFLSLQNKGVSTSTMLTVTSTSLNDAKKVFRQKGTCSQTFCFLLNREFGYQSINVERGSDLLAGGLLQTGHQCGMLWGASLAVGKEAYRRCGNCSQAIGNAIGATQHIMKSFIKRTETANCRPISGCDFTSKWEMTKYMVKIIFTGMNNSTCFNLAEQWAPEAIQSAKDGLSIEPDFSLTPVSCASEMVRKMGGSDEEIAMAGGFAGGMGLSGNACGALGAAIWKSTLDWCKNNPGKQPPYFKNPDAKKLSKAFYSITGSEILCNKICGQSFKTIDEHTEFMNKGGCSKLIEALANS